MWYVAFKYVKGSEWYEAGIVLPVYKLTGEVLQKWIDNTVKILEAENFIITLLKKLDTLSQFEIDERERAIDEQILEEELREGLATAEDLFPDDWD